jgi:hypothetical protein
LGVVRDTCDFRPQEDQSRKVDLLGRQTCDTSCLQNSLLYHRLAEPFPDTCLCTYRGVSQVKSNVDEHASRCFSSTSIFSRLLVTGFCTYPNIPLPGSHGHGLLVCVCDRRCFDLCQSPSQGTHVSFQRDDAPDHPHAHPAGDRQLQPGHFLEPHRRSPLHTFQCLVGTCLSRWLPHCSVYSMPKCLRRCKWFSGRAVG